MPSSPPRFVSLPACFPVYHCLLTCCVDMQWYRTSEQGWRTAIWFSFNGFAQIFGGCVAFGLASHEDSLTVAAWKAIFILTGCLTIAFGIILLWYMPDSPLTARWLSPADRVLAIERIRVNQQGIGNKHFKMYQVWEALRDPMVCLVTFCAVECLPSPRQTWFFFFYALYAMSIFS